MAEIKFKEEFIKRYEKLTDINEFKDITTKFLRRSIRINTLKSSTQDIKSRLEKIFSLTKVPWCDDAFFIEGERRDIGNTIEHSLGYIYIQEAASLIPPLILAPNGTDIILDMAAAPGSKTTQIAALMNNNGLVIANDIKYDRLKSLYINLQRCGVLNTIISLNDFTKIKDFKFDKILLDAPCSGTGAIRKSLDTLRIWNPNMIKRISKLQKKLILTAFENLNENGSLVYSTCSLEPEENEAVINFLLNKCENVKLEDINIENIKRSKPILEFEGNSYSEEISKCLRIWPQDNNTEGFFVAKIRKLS